MRRFPNIPQANWNRAQAMRHSPTRAEQMLWRALRNDQLGRTFRRQHPIGPFIADFVCLEAMLVIELDGDVHCTAEQIAYDHARDRYLRERGYRIKRYPNPEVIKNLPGIVIDIAAAL